MFKNVLAGIVSVILIVAIIAIIPAMLIWSLNTLFNLNIEYEFETMFAAFILLLLVNSNTSSK